MALRKTYSAGPGRRSGWRKALGALRRHDQRKGQETRHEDVPALECPAIEYIWSTDGIGPIAMKTCVQVRGKQATFTGTARHDSGQVIREASWCVLPPKRQELGCAFTLWTTEPFAPGQTLEWDITGPAGRGLPRHRLVLSRMSVVSKLDSVRKLYVEQIEGGNGLMSRDQLKALIANSRPVRTGRGS